MFEAAVPLPKALELLDESLVGRPLAEAAGNICGRLLRGTSLPEALAAQGDAFTNLQVQLVKLGAETGSLHKVLLAIAEHDERRHAMGQQLKSALFYPCMVFVACLAFLILIPPLMFNGLFEMLQGSGQELPLVTRAVAGLSHALTLPWTYPLLALLAYGAWTGGRAVLARPSVRLRLYREAERVPGLGPVLVSARLAHFTSALAVVMRSGLRLDRGLEIACRSCDSPLIEEAAPAMVEALRRGDELATLLRTSGLFPKIVWQSTASGEESGQLPEMLLFLSRFYRRDLENRLVGLAAMLEPLVLGVMGLLVGGLMVACIKPLAASFSQF
jgi:type II secretory pathway component PulF